MDYIRTLQRTKFGTSRYRLAKANQILDSSYVGARMYGSGIASVPYSQNRINTPPSAETSLSVVAPHSTIFQRFEPNSFESSGNIAKNCQAGSNDI